MRLRLRPPAGETNVVLAGFDSIEAAARVAGAGTGVVAAELFGNSEMEMVIDHSGLVAPIERHPWYLIVEVEADPADALDLPEDAVVGPSLWPYRDGITEAIASLGVIHKFDVVVPASRLGALHADLLRRLAPIVSSHSATCSGITSISTWPLRIRERRLQRTSTNWCSMRWKRRRVRLPGNMVWAGPKPGGCATRCPLDVGNWPTCSNGPSTPTAA